MKLKDSVLRHQEPNNAGAGLMPDIVTKSQIEHLKLESENGLAKISTIKGLMPNDLKIGNLLIQTFWVQEPQSNTAGALEKIEFGIALNLLLMLRERNW